MWITVQKYVAADDSARRKTEQEAGLRKQTPTRPKTGATKDGVLLTDLTRGSWNLKSTPRS